MIGSGVFHNDFTSTAICNNVLPGETLGFSGVDYIARDIWCFPFELAL